MTILHSSVNKPSFANGNTASKLSFCERSKFGTKNIFGIVDKSNCNRSEANNMKQKNCEYVFNMKNIALILVKLKKKDKN